MKSFLNIIFVSQIHIKLVKLKWMLEKYFIKHQFINPSCFQCWVLLDLFSILFFSSPSLHSIPNNLFLPFFLSVAHLWWSVNIVVYLHLHSLRNNVCFCSPLKFAFFLFICIFNTATHKMENHIIIIYFKQKLEKNFFLFYYFRWFVWYS